MDKARLIEILSREHKKLEEGGAKWLSEYGANAQRDIGFTFYMICWALAQSTEKKTVSTDLQNQITAYLISKGVQFHKKWNPVDWFTQKWTACETRRASASLSIDRRTDFDPEYTEILKRDRHLSPRPMWLADQYADEVRLFFGHQVGERILHDEAPPMSEESPLTALGRQLFWNPADRMEEVARLLLDKQQLIFYGPPGTGKTFVARALAKHLIGVENPEEFSRFLQFHPSYSYEDFFEGYRPVPSENGGMPQFSLVPGPLKELAEHARKPEHAEKRHVLVIDEINRGNLAKIFGELYFLLEYRDKPIRLQYGGQFSLPENLLMIGTMNTADRSISHIDAALRRRFHFFPLFPDKEPIKGLLDRYLAKEHPHKQLEWIAQVVNLANDGLGRESPIGHSHFMPKNPSDLSESSIRRVWEYSIMPLIEDRFIDQPEEAKKFELERLRAPELA